MSRVLDPRAKSGAASTDAPREVDATRLMMMGTSATAHVDAVRAATKQINLQETFEVELTVQPVEGAPFTAHVIQPVAEQYVERVLVGATVRVKYDPDDLAGVFVDWAASA